MRNKEVVYSLILIFSLFVSVISNTEGKKCYVLALEGGGDKGAYQTGVLKGLVENVPNGETKWDVVTGVSVGAINALMMGVHAVGDEITAVNRLVEAWRELKGYSDIYQNWWGGPLDGLLLKSSIFDNSPLRIFIKNLLKTDTMKRKFVCGATRYDNGSFETFDNDTLNFDEYVEAIISSSAIPVLFPVNKFKDNFYMDGGLIYNLDIASGLHKCFDMGYKEEDIVIDAVLLNSKILPEQNANDVKTLGVLVRYFEITGYANTVRDILDIKRIFPKANYRYIISSSKTLPSASLPITFRPQDIEKMISYGIEDAKTAIGKGVGKTWDDMLNEHKLETEQRLRKRTYIRSEVKDFLN